MFVCLCIVHTLWDGGVNRCYVAGCGRVRQLEATMNAGSALPVWLLRFERNASIITMTEAGECEEAMRRREEGGRFERALR